MFYKINNTRSRIIFKCFRSLKFNGIIEILMIFKPSNCKILAIDSSVNIKVIKICTNE